MVVVTAAISEAFVLSSERMRGQKYGSERDREDVSAAEARSRANVVISERRTGYGEAQALIYAALFHAAVHQCDGPEKCLTLLI